MNSDKNKYNAGSSKLPEKVRHLHLNDFRASSETMSIHSGPEFRVIASNSSQVFEVSVTKSVACLCAFTSKWEIAEPFAEHFREDSLPRGLSPERTLSREYSLPKALRLAGAFVLLVFRSLSGLCRRSSRSECDGDILLAPRKRDSCHYAVLLAQRKLSPRKGLPLVPPGNNKP